MNRVLPSEPVVRKILIYFVVLFVPLFLGVQTALSPRTGISLAVSFALTILLFVRPPWFLFIGLFFFYGALHIVNPDVFGRVQGLFRLKDVFFTVIIAYTAASELLNPHKSGALKKSIVFLPWLLFMLWYAWLMLYTVKILGEAPVLAFRAGRHFLAYTLPFFILRWLKTDRDWHDFMIFLHGLGAVTIFLSLMSALGFPTTFFEGAEELARAWFYEGVFKFYNPGESLVYALFSFNVWRYAHNPSKKNLALLLLFGAGSGLFIFRARLAGLFLGLVVGFFFIHQQAKRRLLAVAVPLLLLLVIFLTLFGVVISRTEFAHQKVYLSHLTTYFANAAHGLTSGESYDLQQRKLFTEIRMPLVRKHPFCGIGFVSPFGSIASLYSRYGIMALGHVDVGWLDALMRLGGIGTLLLSVLLLSGALQGKRLLDRPDLPAEGTAMGLALLGFVFLMFVSTISFSYPTFEPAITTFSILLAWVLHYASLPVPLIVPPNISSGAIVKMQP